MKHQPASPWWLSGTPLETEHHKLMERRASEVPWGESTASALSPAERERAARSWRERTRAEYLAVSTFSVLSMDLCAAGVPADFLSAVHQAAIDEVRHAELCLRLTAIYSGQEELPAQGLSDLPDDPTRDKRLQALSNALLVSCVAETYATTVVAAMRDASTDPCVATVLKIIYADEIRHARLGWSFLAWSIRKGGADAIAAAAGMAPVAVRAVANVVEQAKPAAALSPALRAHGLVPASDERGLFARALREVIVPGFTALGVPVGALVDDYGDAWVAQAATRA